MANEQNLKPKASLTEEEAKRLGANGGRASGKARREKAVISEMYASFLAKKTKVLIDGKPATGKKLIEQVVAQLLAKGSDGAKVALIKEMREALEGSKVHVSGDDLPQIVITGPGAEIDKADSGDTSQASSDQEATP